MLTLPPSVRIYLAVEPVDLRRGHDGLSAIVRGQWGEDLFAGHLWVFLGRRRDRCKILFWDRGGLVLYYKRLEWGRFRTPRVTSDGRAVEMDATATVPPDNNRSEAALRVVALGRKNFLFVGHEDAGDNIAGLYSLVATCEATRRFSGRGCCSCSLGWFDQRNTCDACMQSQLALACHWQGPASA